MDRQPGKTPEVDRFPLRGYPGSRPIYMFDPRPGSHFFSIIVSPEEYKAIMKRGYATLDGVRANIMHQDCHEELGWLRFYLDKPYQRPTE